MLDDYLPSTINSGPWVTAYTLPQLQQRADADFVLPICSLATPYRECLQTGELILPPLFHEALDADLKSAMIMRIKECFPCIRSPSSRLRVVELPRIDLPAVPPAHLLAFSVDTAVEEHGPHLPIATDTIQSYHVLNHLARQYDQLQLARPVEYGQLTWGLPFGFSIDLTAELLSRYVAGYIRALTQWKRPDAVYVVDVHGSITHRQAIVDGLRHSGLDRWTFRWLYEPLAEYASQRGDQHAGGVETALVELASPELIDPDWWPGRVDHIKANQMSFAVAVKLTPDLDAFIREVDKHDYNGVVGDIENYHHLDAEQLLQRMLAVAREDVEGLLRGEANRTAGSELW